MEKFLKNVYGYSNVKNELKLIQSWYINADRLGKKKNLLPKGIIFYGNPGQGKTHIVREYSKSFNYPIFVIEGNEENILDEVLSTYEKAKKEENAIVIIDEIDRLIESDMKLTRIIMSQLDGFKNNENILTLATANNYYNLPEALLREGRFDRHFKLTIDNYKDLEDVIRGFALNAGVKLNDNDVLELLDALYHCSPSEIKALFNNVSLRYGKDCLINDIIDTIDFRKTGFIKNKDDFKVSDQTAIHEAGHAIFIYHFCKTQKFLRIYFNNRCGATVFKQIDNTESKKRNIESIQVSLAGIAAEQLILKEHGSGCELDLENAYLTSFELVNRTCIDEKFNYCNETAFFERHNSSEHNNAIFDKKTRRYLIKQYEYVKKTLKKYRKEIITLANYLKENKQIKRDEFIRLIQ